MIARSHITAVVFLAALLWGVLLIIDGVAVSISWLRHFSTVVGVLLFLLAGFDLWLWRLPFLQGWFVKRPDISGTWRVTIRSNWVDPSTGKTVEPIEGYMVVRQTFSSLSLRLMTSESVSELLGAEIIRAPDGTFRVTGVYRNEPKLSVRERSPIHHGAILLDVVGRPRSALKGHYWTDRGTSGELELTDRIKRILDEFETAREALNISG